jgi:hypothetical protein
MARLQPVDEDLWVAQFPHRLMGVNLGRQMAVVRLPDDSGLVLISPGPPDDVVQHELARIGPVRHIVAPSCFHDTFVPEVLQAYPSASLHASPGFDHVLKVDRTIRDLTGPMPESWQGVFDTQLIAGMPKVNEVVFHHLPSRTLIVADLVFNLAPHADLWTRAFMSANGAFGGVRASRIFRLSIRDRVAQQESLRAVLRWNFERLIPSHGLVLLNGARDLVARAWNMDARR